jgi:hypothetical protein
LYKQQGFVKVLVDGKELSNASIGGLKYMIPDFEERLHSMVLYGTGETPGTGTYVYIDKVSAQPIGTKIKITD